jgi:hypothetical protein
VKWTGDGVLIEFRNVVDAVRCATEAQKRSSATSAFRVTAASNSVSGSNLATWSRKATATLWMAREWKDRLLRLKLLTSDKRRRWLSELVSEARKPLPRSGCSQIYDVILGRLKDATRH